MLTLSGSLRVFLALEPCDMRKSFDGLHAEVVAQPAQTPPLGWNRSLGTRKTA
jgi:transposase